MKAEVWYNAGMGFTLLPTGVPPGKRLFDLFLTVLASWAILRNRVKPTEVIR